MFLLGLHLSTALTGRVKLVIVSLVLFPLFACGVYAQTYQPVFTAVDLGDFGWGNLGTTAINNAGQIAVTGDAPGSPPDYEGLEVGVIQVSSGNVATITNLSHSGDLSFAGGINDSGQIVGFYRGSGAAPPYKPYQAFAALYSATSNGSTLPSDLGDNCAACAINKFGAVVGYTNSSYPILPVLLTSSQAVLGTLGGNITIPYGINFSNQIVGYSRVTGNAKTHAVLWRPVGASGFQLIDLTPSSTSSGAYNINDAGIITGSSDYQAVLFSVGSSGQVTQTSLGVGGEAIGINNSGIVVGIYTTGQSTNDIPFYYTPSTGTRPLLSLISGWKPAGFDITSVNEGYIRGFNPINDRGQIVGVDTSTGHVILLNPIQPPASVGLRSDVNGDHQIDFSSTSLDTTTSTAPFRFWLNDDHDTGDQTNGNDLNDGVADNADTVISSIRDLEDFAPLNLYLPSSVVSSLHQGAKIVFSVTGSGSLHLVPMSQPGFDYLYDPVYARSLTPLPGIGVSPVPMYLASAAATVSVPLDQLFSNPQAGDRTLGYIFEGVSAGDLVLSGQVIDANGSVVAQTENFYLHLGEITEFYNHFTVGNSEAMNAPVATTVTELNPNAPDSTNPNVPYILFVHGWRLHTWERVKFAETAYKRLYWAGYRGEFGMFSWPTEWVDIPDSYYEKASIFSSLTNRGNYDRSELQAWKSATGLRNLIDSQLESGSQPRVRILAHSMGNVVASEALKLGMNKTGSKKIYSYIASQAATVASAYDMTVPNVSGDGLAAYPGSDIYRQWPLNSYKNYFLGIHGMSASGIYSFCNPSDYALSSIFSWPSNQSLKPDVGYAYLLGSQQYAVYDSNGQANPIPYGVTPDSYTAFAFAAPASSNALGAEPLTGGEIQGTVRLDSYPFHYTDAKTDHSAEFLSTIQYQHYYWEEVLGYSGLRTVLSNPVTTTPSSFQNWGLMWFGFSGTDTAPQASFSGDGISNLTKYAFGLNPLQAGGVPQVTVSHTAMQGQVQIEFWCRANLTDVSYTVEQSSDLKTWSAAAVSLSVVSSSGQLQLVSGVVPDGGATQQFYRIRVGLTQ